MGRCENFVSVCSAIYPPRRPTRRYRVEFFSFLFVSFRKNGHVYTCLCTHYGYHLELCLWPSHGQRMTTLLLLLSQIPLGDVLDVERRGKVVWIKCLHLGTIGFEASLETDAVIFYLAMDSLLDTRCGVGGGGSHESSRAFLTA